MSKWNVEKKQYVEILNKAFEPLTTFGKLEYAHERNSGREFIKYEDAMCVSKFLDVTSFDLERILMDCVVVAIGDCPQSVVSNPNERITIAKIFNEK